MVCIQDHIFALQSAVALSDRINKSQLVQILNRYEINDLYFKLHYYSEKMTGCVIPKKCFCIQYSSNLLFTRITPL